MNPTDLINPLCPTCHSKRSASCRVEFGRSYVRCGQCWFEVSAHGVEFMMAGWAWNALPRPKPKTTQRKGKKGKP